MKSVLISIRPEWCEKIASGEKTVEVRKTRPNLEPPFKVYIYCTKNTKKNARHTYIRSGYGRKEFGIIEQWRSGKEVVEVNAHLPAYRYNAYLAEGKVIGEFVCDEIYETRWVVDFEYGNQYWDVRYKSEDDCLSDEEIAQYIGYKSVYYGWHISNLVIYDQPKELSDFYKFGAETLEELSDREELCQYCSRTGYGEHASYGTHNGPVFCEGRFCDEAYQEYLDENFALTRPPQSWCYVKEVQT